MKSSVSAAKPTRIGQWQQAATAELLAADIDSAALDARLLLCHITGHPAPWLIAHDYAILTTEQLARLAELLARRCDHEPLAYLLGWREFYGRPFTVDRRVLIPRPESEAIIEVLLRLPLPDSPSIIDVGTGSGCLGITAGLELPTARVTLSDSSADALAVAAGSARQMGIHVSLTQADLLTGQADHSYDAIIANLPYVARDWPRSPGTDYEPSVALFAEQDGLALIHRLITQARSILKSGGYLLLESDQRQQPSIVAFAREHAFAHQHTSGLAMCFRLIG